MPKTRKDRSVSFERPLKSPRQCSSSLTNETKPTSAVATAEDVKEWEEARCSVCMEHPHNAVLLLCSSYDKGCHPYMCDTSYRHSNCLDQFRKSFAEATSTTTHPSDVAEPTIDSSVIATVESSEEQVKTPARVAVENLPSMHKLQQKLVCPLCRGQISGWVVVDSARDFMNAKTRNCASETCEYTGNYTDLRKHARLEHPQVRPSVADPERQRDWRRLERQRDIGDVLSTIQSSLGEDTEDDDESILPMDERGWITIFFLFRVWRPSSSSPRSFRARTRAQQGTTTTRRRSVRLWGESYDADHGSVSASVEDGESSDGSISWRRRVRRRLSTPDDEV